MRRMGKVFGGLLLDAQQLLEAGKAAAFVRAQ